MSIRFSDSWQDNNLKKQDLSWAISPGPFLYLQLLDSRRRPPPRPRHPASLCWARRSSRAAPASTTWSPALEPAPSPQDSVPASSLPNPGSLQRAPCRPTLPHNKWVTQARFYTFVKNPTLCLLLAVLGENGLHANHFWLQLEVLTSCFWVESKEAWVEWS